MSAHELKYKKKNKKGQELLSLLWHPVDRHDFSFLEMNHEDRQKTTTTHTSSVDLLFYFFSIREQLSYYMLFSYALPVVAQ